MSDVLHSELVLPPGDPKEACLFSLDEGRLALFYDQDRQLTVRTSADRGRTWGDPAPLKTAQGEPIRGHRTSLVRLRSGAIGLFHTHLPHVLRGRDGPLRFRVSKDAGSTWSEGVFVDPTFAVQRNGTARVLSNGRIVSPVFVWLSSLVGPESEIADNSICYSWTYFSDDEGQTWQASSSQLLVRLDHGRRGYYSFEEPCIEELHDGRLLMFGRTELGRQFISHSADRGASWTEPSPGPLASAYAPMLLARVPTTHDLLAVWNQASADEILAGPNRHRLTAAISRDDGQTWRHFRNLESPDAKTQIEPPPLQIYRTQTQTNRSPDGPPSRICYPSVAFMGNEAAIAYDYGELSAGGKRGHATKLAIVPIEWFYES